MSTLLLPDLAREMAAFNRRVADSVEAETRRVEKLREAMEPDEALRKRATLSAREALRHTLSQAPDAQAVWHTVLELLKDGLSGEELTELLRDVRDAVETWLTLAQKTRGLCESAKANSAAEAGLAELARAEASVREVKAAAEKVAAFMSRPRPPIDPARLQRGREEADQGRVRSPEQMRAGPEGRQAQSGS